MNYRVYIDRDGTIYCGYMLYRETGEYAIQISASNEWKVKSEPFYEPCAYVLEHGDKGGYIPAAWNREIGLEDLGPLD